MAKRPSDEWQRRVDEEAAELARGTLSPEFAPARHLWPESLRVATDAALARFEGEVRALSLPSDEDILGVVEVECWLSPSRMHPNVTFASSLSKSPCRKAEDYAPLGMGADRKDETMGTGRRNECHLGTYRPYAGHAVHATSYRHLGVRN